MDASALEIITFSIAVLGAALGVINTLHNLDKSRVKLKVTPVHAIPVGGMDESLRFGNQRGHEINGVRVVDISGWSV